VLNLARSVTRASAPSLRAARPRAVALLARQALETAVDDVWERLAPSTHRVPMRAKLLCFEELLSRQLAGEIAYAWTALSNAVHFHPYELAPSGVEVEELVELTAQAIGQLEKKNRSN
jgi:hypothetical protein